MTARLSESAAGVRAMRVVSVSPATVRVPKPQATADEGCSNDLIDLSGRSEEIIASLRSALDQAAMSDAQTRDSVRNLQDRLRVSARMLQAFEAQISRIEEGIGELEHQREVVEQAAIADAARLDDQAAAFEQRLEAAMERFERRLAELLCTR
jgi:septal ring factor EnvC (AmiA/AmiB activator)